MNRMTHPIEPEEVMAYLDGELAADRAAIAAAHLGECAECQGLVAELRNISQNLNTWKVDPPESAIPPTVAAALTENRPQLRNVSWWRNRSWRELLSLRSPIIASTGVAVVILLISFGVINVRNRHKIPVFTQIAEQMSTEDSRGAALAAPQSVPIKGRNFTQQAQLQTAPPITSAGPQADQLAPENNLVANGPMIIRTAQLNLVTKEFDKARSNLEAILKWHRGYVGELNASGNTGSGRTLTATLRVPADQLDATLAEVKTLGRVESESQGGQDVTSQYVDLEARLGNARNTEDRLTDLLRNRTGKLSDVLAVEQELDRVRGEIEQMEAERKNMAKQVSYATLNATITEDYKAQLQVVPPSTATRISNAAVDGYRSMVDGVVSLALFVLSTGPSLLLWGAILFFPARFAWKKLRRSLAAQ
jgi:anti-sigma factor RsiW